MQALKTIGILAAMAGLLAGCSSGPQPATSPENPNAQINNYLVTQARYWEAAPEYVVEPPDEITVMVKDNQDLKTAVIVRPDGRISLPLVGDIFVGGKTVAQIEQDLETKYARYIRNANVTVIVTGFKSKHVFVYGEVERPGQYPYTGRDTVVGVIAQAGTLNWRAAPNGIQVTRGDPNNPTILPVRMKDIVIDDDDITNYFLQANDIIWVPPTAMVKVGDVMKEILYPLQGLVAPATVYATYDQIYRND